MLRTSLRTICRPILSKFLPSSPAAGRGGSPAFAVLGRGRPEPPQRSRSVALPLVVHDCSRCRFTEFELGAHLLDLRCLLFETPSQFHNVCSEFLLLLRYRRL